MKNVLSRISDLTQEAHTAFEKIESPVDLEQFERRFLSKKSVLAEISKGLGQLPEAERKHVGKEVQKIRAEFIEKVEARRTEFEATELEKKLASDWIDVTKSLSRSRGALHPISQVQRRVEEIFTSMGFEIADGPEIETEWHNFDALNIPATHPARDMQDTFWLKSGANDPRKNFVLRTHTSPVQIRKMLKDGAPVRVIVPGRVFRNEDVDMSHDTVFYQVEGLLVDEGISLAHLKGSIETMLTELFEHKTKIRFRPGYFPFVEPGLEVDFLCVLCDGKGCRTCKNTGWIEFMGAGMVHPNVLKNCGIDSKKYSGFAFGFGLTRLAMMKFGIDDIRLLSSQKVEFLSQF